MSAISVVLRSMGGQRGELSLAGLLGSAASLCAIALLGTSGWLLATAATHPPVLALSAAAVLVRAAAIGRGVLRYAERLVGHDAAFRGLTKLRVTVYSALERLAPTGLAAFGRGDVLARLVGDVDTSLDLPLRVILPWVQGMLVASATVAMLAWILPADGLLVGIVSLVALTAVPALSAILSRRADARLAPARAALADCVVRALDAAPDLLASGSLPRALAALRSRDREVTRLHKREAVGLGAGDAAALVAQGIAVAGVLALTVPAVAAGRLDPPWLAVAALLPLALMDVLAALPGSALALLRVHSSAQRLVEVMSAPDPVPPVTAPAALPAGLRAGSDEIVLALANVHARWSPPDTGRVAALRGVWCDVQRGRTTAVVGPSGSGKSTLASVILGFLPYEGNAVLAGAELRDVDGDDIRAHVALMSQRAHVFDTSVAENLRLGDATASAERLLAVLDSVQLTPWISRLPDGLDTQLGPFGVTMSGGERQRLALARLLLADRDLVVLDEPTEHLDPATAEAVGRTIRSVLEGVTTILITHRLSDAAACDYIVELQEGIVTASGSHQELMSEGGWYAHQWHAQAQQKELAEFLSRLPVGVAVPRADLPRAPR